MSDTLVRPRGLAPGDVVGVISPSGPTDAHALERGVAELESLGLGVRVSRGALMKTGFTAGDPATRLRELRAMIEDPSVAGLFCARGGAGALHLLDGLDVGLLRRHAKPLVGCSDATCLHAAFAHAGVVSFHGPMVAKDLAEGRFDADSLRAALFRDAEGPAPFALSCLLPGSARGRLRGGCLSLVSALVGTRWAARADAEGTILFLEDVDERPYRIDRMLFQLRAAGAFEGVTGIVFGELPGCQPGDAEGYALEDVLLEALSVLDIPVAFGLASGHVVTPALTLPLGVLARLECAAGASRLTLEERGVS